MRITIICKTCGSKEVTRDAWAEWNEESQQWVLAAAYDYAYCHKCENDARLAEMPLNELSPIGQRES